MKRKWFNPIIHFVDLVDGNKYYCRLYEFEFVPMLMSWDAATTTFQNGVTGTSYDFTIVNRVSAF